MYEKALSQMRNMLKDTDLIIVTDSEGKVMYYNNFNDKLNKFGNQNAVGRSIFELYPWLTKENSTIFKVLETGEPLVNHIQDIKLNDDFSVYALNSAFPLINDQGIIGAIEISTDLTKETKNNRAKSKYSNFGAKYNFDDIITQNPEMLALINILKNVSENNSNIFIYGETGTGKEILAHSVHQQSKRSNKPFVTQNCAAIPPSIMESILFGTVRGSYTGAEDKPGLFEIADGGTVYLDEINSMPLELQAKLLRVIEDKTVRRIGGNRDICVDIRFISSTNEKPSEMIEGKRFRTDLFFRLNVVNVEIPPLRQRRDDIEILLQYFINRFNIIFNKNVDCLDPKAKNLLYQYDWAGNVREFRNCIESAFNIVEGNTICIQHLPSHILSSMKINLSHININKTLPELVEEYEKEIIEKILAKNRFNVNRAAGELGIPRQTLYYKLSKYDLMGF